MYSSAGVTVVTQKDTVSVDVGLKTHLEAVGVEILTDRLTAVFSLYIPPLDPLVVEYLKKLI